MYEKIIVPIDGSENAHAALIHAIEIANMFQSEIEILHVVSYSEQYRQFMPYPVASDSEFSVPSQWMEEYIEKIEENSKKMLEEARNMGNKMRPKVKIYTKLLKGKPGALIVEEAHEGKFNLIAMGSRGLGSLGELLLGSISNYVVNNAKIPVLIVNIE